MLYKDFLKKSRRCPFCDRINRTIIEYKNAFLTYSIAPYSSHHLLVVPKRHIKSFIDLKREENREISNLLKLGVRMLHEYGLKNCTILMRDGDNSAKSVEHLHYHIIPNHRIGDLDNKGKKRRVLGEKEVDKIMTEMGRCLKNLEK